MISFARYCICEICPSFVCCLKKKIFFFFLMCAIFKVCIQLVITLLLFRVLAFCLWGLWNPSSPTRDRTQIPWVGRWSRNPWTTSEVPHACSLGQESFAHSQRKVVVAQCRNILECTYSCDCWLSFWVALSYVPSFAEYT